MVIKVIVNGRIPINKANFSVRFISHKKKPNPAILAEFDFIIKTYNYKRNLFPILNALLG